MWLIFKEKDEPNNPVKISLGFWQQIPMSDIRAAMQSIMNWGENV